MTACPCRTEVELRAAGTAKAPDEAFGLLMPLAYHQEPDTNRRYEPDEVGTRAYLIVPVADVRPVAMVFHPAPFAAYWRRQPRSFAADPPRLVTFAEMV